MKRRRTVIRWGLPLLALVAACLLPRLAHPNEPPTAVTFVNAARDRGLSFVLDNGATPDKHQIETMAGGVAVIDFDDDGRPDLYFTNGAHMPAMVKDAPRFFNRLFRNRGDGTFEDVTEKAGVQGRGFCTGVAVGDYDNDGRQDIFVACRPDNILYHNLGNGRFEDVATRAGVASPQSGSEKLWSIGAGWFDLDNDGYLDLFVSNYCDWSPSNNPFCGYPDRGGRIYCDPRQFRGQPNTLYRNSRGGTFTDVSRAAGIAGIRGYGMGVAFADFNIDGHADVFVANDSARNLLFENDGRGHLIEKALRAGVAYASDGQTVSGMGADFRDLNNDGLPDIFMTALSTETWPLFLNVKGSQFRDITFSSATGRDTAGMSGWCNGMFDLDNDGFKDLFAVRSHVFDNSMEAISKPYAEPVALFLNLGGARFRSASAEAGADFNHPAPRRGCAFADFDGDGKVDVVTTSIGGPAELLLNRSNENRNWIEFRLVGRASNRDGIGAVVKLTEPSGRTQYNHATTSVGYASSSDRRVHFGLGGSAKASDVEIRWPGGIVQTLSDVPANRVVRVVESARSEEKQP